MLASPEPTDENMSRCSTALATVEECRCHAPRAFGASTHSSRAASTAANSPLSLTPAACSRPLSARAWPTRARTSAASPLSHATSTAAALNSDSLASSLWPLRRMRPLLEASSTRSAPLLASSEAARRPRPPKPPVTRYVPGERLAAAPIMFCALARSRATCSLPSVPNAISSSRPAAMRRSPIPMTRAAHVARTQMVCRAACSSRTTRVKPTTTPCGAPLESTSS